MPSLFLLMAVLITGFSLLWLTVIVATSIQDPAAWFRGTNLEDLLTTLGSLILGVCLLLSQL